jgi:hypothetical protein
MKPYNLLNQKFGRLFVTEKVGLDKRSYVRWKCQCDCGKVIVTTSPCLVSGKSKSCGCLGAENRLKSVTKHGATKNKQQTNEYVIWNGIKNRCYNTKNISYKNYGGRGIKLCEEWHDFSKFLKDVGFRPSKDHSLDRINPNGDYEPGNCRWATKKEQAANRRLKVFAGPICCPNCKTVFNPYEKK